MLTAIPTLAGHLTCLIQALCAIVLRDGRRPHVPRPLIVLANNRVARLANRFIGLVDRFCAGTLSPPGAARRRPASLQPAAGPSWRTRHVAWLLRMMKPEVANCALALQHFLSLPEMGELVGAAPQAGHILRPLCRILGVKIPPELRLPRCAAPAPPSAALPDPAPADPWLPPPDPEPLDPPDAAVFVAVSQEMA